MANQPDKPAGPSPRGSQRKSFLLRMSPALYAELRTWADQEFRSLNAQIEYLLADAVRRRRGRDT